MNPHGRIYGNKYWEIDIGWWKESESVLECEFAWTRRCDHAGILFGFSILSFRASFNIYDNRHWDYDNKTWEVYKNEDNNVKGQSS